MCNKKQCLQSKNYLPTIHRQFQASALTHIPIFVSNLMVMLFHSNWLGVQNAEEKHNASNVWGRKDNG